MFSVQDYGQAFRVTRRASFTVGPRSFNDSQSLLLPETDLIGTNYPLGGSPMAEAKCRVLCVDDHEDTSEMLQLVLANEDYEVTLAKSVSQAIELASTTHFDLYVLDRHLPDG